MGVFVGIEMQDFQEVLRTRAASVYLATGSSLSVAAGRLSFTMGLHGPCAAYLTACSASLTAYHVARRSVQLNECAGSVAAGVNMMLLPGTSIALGLAGMSSALGRCHTFDARADGYARGEAIVAATLRRGHSSPWSASGSAVRSDGRSASLTAPNAQAQIGLLVAALADSATSPDELVQNAAHGTGTSLGDPIEANSLAASVLDRRSSDGPPLLFGSVKANIGHTEPAAGTTGLLKLAFGLRDGEAAPNAQLRIANPHVVGALRGKGCAMPVQGSATALGGSGGVSSFGYQGTIVHAVLRHTAGDIAAPLAPLVYKRRSFPWRDPNAAESAMDFSGGNFEVRKDTKADGEPLPPVVADVPLMEAGFTSIMAARLASELQTRLRTAISPVVLFQYPTPRLLESHLQEVASEMADELNGVDQFTGFLTTFRESARARFEAGDEEDDRPLEEQFDTDLRELDIGPIPADTPSTILAEPRIILLTGCTGWLGSFVLAELLQQTKATVYCLVRAASPLEGRRRIESGLAKLGLLSLPLHRIVVFTGSLERDHLGLSMNDYNLLAHSVDAIWHNGARVDHVVSYAKLRASNVSGTAEVLKLAVDGKIKAVHFVSTYASLFCSTAAGAGLITEDSPLPGNDAMGTGSDPALVNGYSQSKWIAELLVLQASAHGLPVTIHRPGRVLSSHLTGACNTDDLMTRLIVGCVQLGSLPNMKGGGGEYGAPVDAVAAAIVALGLEAHRSSSFGGTYHVFDREPTSYIAVFLALGIDYELSILEADAWLSALKDDAHNVARPLLHELEEMDKKDGTKVPLFDNSGTIAALAKLSRQLGPSLDYAHACRQLEFLRRVQMLPPARTVAPADWLFRSLAELYASEKSEPPPPPPAVDLTDLDEEELDCICMACDDSACDFKPVEMQRRRVGKMDVCIEVLYCGVCHSDLTNAACHLPGAPSYPMVPGHEVVGVCTRVGAGVSKFKVGDHVGVGNIVDSCLECHSCLDDKEQWCAKMVPTYNGKDWSGRAASGGGVSYTLGGYSTAMVVHERFCITVPKGYPLEHVGPVMCAGTTMYDPLREAGVTAGTRLGIIGLGGLGVMGIKLGKALGCTVTVISRGEAKRDLAIRSGADIYIASADESQMAAHAGSLDLILNTIPSNHDASPFLDLLIAEGGKHVHVGLHASSIAAGASNYLLPGRSRERMTFIGGVQTTQEVMDLCARDDIRTEIDIRPVGELNRIFEALDSSNESGKRFVLDIRGTLTGSVSTGPATRLSAHPPPAQTLREVAEAMIGRLLPARITLADDNDQTGQEELD